MKMNSITTFVVLLLLPASLAWASSGITYHGRIMKPGGQPLESATTRFRIQIKAPDAGNCVLWEEEQTRNMLGSEGVFTITIGDSTNTGIAYNRIDAYGWPMERVFSNRLPFNTLIGCAVGNSYAPNPADGRILEVSFKENPTNPDWEDFPATRINLIPMALNSLQLEGFRANEFLKIDPIVNQTPLTNANVSSLLSLIAGTSSLYSKSTDALAGDLSGTIGLGTVVGIRGRAVTPDVPAAGQVLKFDGTAWAPANDDSGGSMGDASYLAKGIVRFDTDAATSGISVTAGVARLADTITAAGPVGGASTVPVITYDAKGRLTTVSTAAVNDTSKLPLAGGTMTGAINMGLFNITNATSVAANNFSGRNLLLTDSDTNIATLRAPVNIAADYTLTLPTAAPVNGYVLSSDGTGQLSWIPAATGSVTSVSATAPVLSSGGATPVISLDTGLGASKIPQVGGAPLAANGVIVANGLGTALTSLNCTVGQVVKFDAGGVATCAADNAGDPNAFVNGGNSFGTAATLGTDDAFPLNFETQGTTKMTVLANGNVGIGTASPTYKLDISGDTYVNGTLLASSNSGSASAARFDQGSVTNPTINMVNIGVGTAKTFNVTTSNGGAALAVSNNETVTGGSNLTGVRSGIRSTGSYIQSSAGDSASDIYGILSYPAKAGSGVVTNFSGINGSVSASAGTVSNASSILASSNTKTGGTITNNYGVYIQSQSAGTNNYQLYSVGTAPSYFAGNVGIGTTTPTALLDLATTNTSAASAARGFKGAVTFAPAASTSQPAIGIDVSSTFAPTATSTSTSVVYGGYFRSLSSGSSVTSIGAMVGTESQVSHNSNGTVLTAAGARNSVTVNTSGGSVPTAIGTDSQVSVTLGITTAAYGTKAAVSTAASASSVVGEAFGGHFGVSRGAGSGILNAYGAYTGIIEGTNKWSFYASDATAPSYFAGNVGIGTTSPATKLDVAGAVRIGNDATACAAGLAGSLRYNASVVEFCNGSSWQAFGVSGSGLTSLNGQTSSTQTFANGSAGTAPAISSASNVHTLNVPLASGTGVLSGTISKTDYDNFNSKLTSPLTTKGDLLVQNATVAARLPAGTNGQVLTANSATATGLEWTAAATGDITSVIAGAGLITGGTSGDVTLDVAAGNGILVAADAVAVDAGLGANKIPQVGGAAIAANGLVVANGTGTALTSLNCTVGQVVKFNVSGVAECATDNTGSANAFVQDGNTFGAAATLGTNDAFALNFETQGTTKMTVLTNGDVGIATTSPTSKLDVVGNVTANAVAATAGGNVNSGGVKVVGNYWTGAASATDTWTMSANLGTGSTPVSTLSLTHTGPGYTNFAVGTEALANNTNNSYQNIAIGDYAQRYMRPVGFWSNNIALGYSAMRGSTTPADNTATSNIAIGNFALGSATSGSTNIGIGGGALQNNTDGGSSVAIGSSAQQNMRPGAAGSNVSIGTASLMGSATVGNNTGTLNVAVGNNTMSNLSSGIENVAIGWSSLNVNSTGSGNVAVGSTAGPTSGNTGLSNTIAIGKGANVTGSNAIAIGYNASAAANTTVIGVTGTTTSTILHGNVGIGTTSPNARLTISGAATSRTNIIATGATVDLSLSNNHLLKDVGGSVIALQNLADGGVYNLSIFDLTDRMYTFTGCTNTYFSPANGTTLFRSSYSISVIIDGANTECLISWSTGFN